VVSVQFIGGHFFRHRRRTFRRLRGEYIVSAAAADAAAAATTTAAATAAAAATTAAAAALQTVDSLLQVNSEGVGGGRILQQKYLNTRIVFLA
jgi:hypothetical protein